MTPETRLGSQIPDFTYPGVDTAGLFDVVARQAREADSSGFDTVLVMDHVNQPRDAVVARDREHRPGTQRCWPRRSRLDVVSNGRPMLAGGSATLDGTWYRVDNTMNHPAPVSKIPIMIGGGGEKKTLRMIAQCADESNLICDDAEIARKLDALDAHCATLGRDRSEITVSKQKNACIAPTHDEARADVLASFARRGLDTTSMSDDDLAQWLGLIAWGGPDEIAEHFAPLLP